jgi:hypothetical protein
MKYLTRLRRARPFVFALTLGCAVLVAAGVWRAAAGYLGKGAENKQLLYSRIHKGVGTEVEFATANSSVGDIRASVNSVDNFMFKRSGSKLSGATKNRLTAMEARVLSGAARRLTISELAGIMAATALERASALTDQEIAHMDKSVRGFDAPDLPESFRHGHERLISTRAGSLQIMSSDKFVGQMKALRAQIATPVGEVFEGATRKAVYEEVSRRAALFSGAVPEKLGGLWDIAADTEGVGVTPLQAVMLAYSVASEDLLCDSEVDLGRYMKSLQAARSAAQQYPSPVGHFAYGENGYVFSSPIDLVFDDQTVNRFLDRIEERSAR